MTLLGITESHSRISYAYERKKHAVYENPKPFVNIAKLSKIHQLQDINHMSYLVGRNHKLLQMEFEPIPASNAERSNCGKILESSVVEFLIE